MTAVIYTEYLDPNFDFSACFLYVQVMYRWYTVSKNVCEFSILYVNNIHMGQALGKPGLMTKFSIFIF